MRFLVALWLLLGAGAASAHAILTGSTPAAQGSLAAGRREVVLRFNSRIDAARSRLALRAGTSETLLAIEPGGEANVLATHVDLKPGRYVLRWQVLATDGHITRGDLPFTVAP